jgi:hypothetical protein
MKTLIPRLPRIACSAELPVSPDVAPRTLSVRRSFASVYSKRLPRSCSAMSLNGERRPVRQVHQVDAGLELRDRRDRVVGRRSLRVGPVDQRFQVGGRNVGDEARQDREREIGVEAVRALGARAQRVHLPRGEARVLLRHGEPSVGREALEQDRRERLRVAGPRAARRDIAHRSVPS